MEKENKDIPVMFGRVALKESLAYPPKPLDVFPEILKTLTFEPFTDQFIDEYDNFETGVVLKTTKGIYLVGDVNNQLGVCDDCNIHNEEILEIAHIKQLIKT